MSVGAGITAAAGIFAIVAVIFKLVDRNKEEKTPSICMAHSGVLSSIANIEGWMKGISEDVKELLRKVG
jgi:hypothetical protein